MAISDWANIRARTNEMRMRLFEPLTEGIEAATSGIARGQQIRRQREAQREEQFRREQESGAFADLARISEGGLSRQALVSFLDRNKGKISTNAAAGILRDAERMREQTAEAEATAKSLGIEPVPGLPASAYPALAKQGAERTRLAELAPVLEGVRAGKPVDPMLRAKFQEDIIREETALRTQAKQKADEESNLEEQAALEQMFGDPAKMTPRQKALVTAKYQRQQTFESGQADRETTAREISAVDSASPDDLAGIRVTSPEAANLKARRVGFMEGIRKANEQADRAEKSSDRAERSAAVSAQQAVRTSAEAALDEIAPRDTFTKARVIQPGKERRAGELQTAIDGAAARIADLSKMGPGGGNRVKDLLDRVEKRTATPEERAEFLRLTEGK